MMRNSNCDQHRGDRDDDPSPSTNNLNTIQQNNINRSMTENGNNGCGRLKKFFWGNFNILLKGLDLKLKLKSHNSNYYLRLIRKL